MNARTQFLVVSVCLATTIAKAGTLVIDDFTDPARIELPGGPESVVTPNVGDLNAERTLRFSGGAVRSVVNADSSTTTPGHYSVDLQYASWLTIADLVYTEFGNDSGTADFSDGGRNDAFFIDVTSAPMNGPPAVMLLARESSGRFLVRDFTTSGLFFHPTTPSCVVVPFSSFTHRDFRPIFDADFSSITEFFLRFSTGEGRPAWQAQIDRISVGKSASVPEPASHLLAIFVFIVGAAYRVCSVHRSECCEGVGRCVEQNALK